MKLEEPRNKTTARRALAGPDPISRDEMEKRLSLCNAHRGVRDHAGRKWKIDQLDQGSSDGSDYEFDR